jgi:NADH-quinone oxidoreductase subunit L
MMALAGVPVLSGFWSKDEILHAASVWSISRWPFYLGLFGALLTAFYMTRQMCYVFLGRYRDPDVSSETHSSHSQHPPHESPSVMTIPLMILAFFAVLLGFIGTPAWPWFHGYLTGHNPSLNLGNLFDGMTIAMMLGSTAVVVIGIGLAWRLYGPQPVRSAEEPDILERMRPEVFSALRNKFYVDELYEATVIRFNDWGAWACDWLDRWVWSGAVRLVSYVVLGFSWLNRFFDEYVVNLGFDQGCRQIRKGGGFMSGLQKGQVQQYLRVIGIALTALLLLLTWGFGQ